VLSTLIVTIAAGCAVGARQGSASLPGCSGLLLIGVRGSGENPTLDHALGSTIGDLYHRLTTAHPSLHAAAYGLPYAAATTSSTTVIDASSRLVAIVVRRHRQCPGEHLVIAGFSLGAEIIGDALQNPILAGGVPPFSAAVVLADPRFNPADTATAAGTFNPSLRNPAARAPYPRQLAGRIRAYCRDHDPICQPSDPAAAKSEHGRYVPQQTCQALAFIETRTGVTVTSPSACGQTQELRNT
jgi:hypothetical protein